MVRATCGVPTTVTVSLNATVAAMASPAMKTPLAPRGVPDSVRPATVGTMTSVPSPSTVKSESSAIAWVPRPSAALLPAASAIVPPFSPSAEAPTATPFASWSALTTR